MLRMQKELLQLPPHHQCHVQHWKLLVVGHQQMQRMSNKTGVWLFSPFRENRIFSRNGPPGPAAAGGGQEKRPSDGAATKKTGIIAKIVHQIQKFGIVKSLKGMPSSVASPAAAPAAQAATAGRSAGGRQSATAAEGATPQRNHNSQRL
eukprot:GHVS01041644.1.p1 GENE.GHVS01041644.1~~GHVS01041644.1.p1  ORF type:complete len:149 (+),score=26.91 GHVS01041644.1:229-675(+)